MRQQRGANAAGATPEDDARITGPEASVLEPPSVSSRTPQGSNAVRPDGREASRLELLAVSQTHSGGIAGKTVRAKGCGVRWCPQSAVEGGRSDATDTGRTVVGWSMRSP